MPVPSLKHLATATAIKHVKSKWLESWAEMPFYRIFFFPFNLICFYLHLVLDDIGSLPYALARPVLLKVDNPEKLVSGS
jgi:elongin-A